MDAERDRVTASQQTREREREREIIGDEDRSSTPRWGWVYGKQAQ